MESKSKKTCHCNNNKIGPKFKLSKVKISHKKTLAIGVGMAATAAGAAGVGTVASMAGVAGLGTAASKIGIVALLKSGKLHKICKHKFKK